MTGGEQVVEVRVPARDVDLASGMLWEAGIVAIEERPADGGGVLLVAGVAPGADAGLVAGALAARWPSSVVVVDEAGWRDAWRAHARPVRAGRRFLVVPVHRARGRPRAGPPGSPGLPGPAGMRDDADTADGHDDGHRGSQAVPGGDAEQADGDDDGGRLRLEVDPGWAFGSGSHPSTRLALAALEDVVAPGASVLDVGCGSGVLSLAAAALGAGQVVAVDVDPHAVDATRANAVAAGVAVDASATPLAEVGGTYDVVVANILPGVLTTLAPDLVARVAAHGWVVLSGIPVDRAEAVVAAFPPSAVRHRSAEGWVALELWCALPRGGAPAGPRGPSPALRPGAPPGPSP